jgi:hypothetical protein
MAFEFVFQIDPEQIRIQDPQTGYHLEMSNRAVIRQSDGELLALGEPEEKARAILDSRRRGPAGGQDGEIRTIPLFAADGAWLACEIQAMKHFTWQLHKQSAQARPMAHFLTKLRDGFDYILTIPGYEDFPAARRQALEQSLQAHLRLRRLVINGREVQIPIWKRNLEFWLRRLLAQALPIAAILGGYLTMPSAAAGSPFSFLAYLMAIAYLSYYGGRLLWMLLARSIVPYHYRLYMLQGTHRRLSRIDQMLARAVWGSPRRG